MFSSVLPSGVNFTFAMELKPCDQLPANILVSLSLPKQLLFCLLTGNSSLLDWRELVICTVKIGVVVTVGLICWFYHWRKVDGGDSTDLINDAYDYESPKSLCGICFERTDASKMFENKICSHSFCCDCTTKHIAAKIESNSRDIFCPEVNCKTLIDFHSSRKILSKSLLVKWDELLCKSLIPVSERVYCPFMDCLALMVNESGRKLKQVKCPACRRLFCATCCVPWHTEFRCGEYMRLDERREKRGEEFVNELAKKYRWRRCPNCKIFVEKTEGCIHITCRCKFEFCYRCGIKWCLHKGACKSGS